MSVKVESIDIHSPQLQGVKELGRQNAGTLGFLPEGAFDDHARKRQILVACDLQGKCIGYVLYRITRNVATIVHLCVAESIRGSGVARLLVDKLKEETRDLYGIKLKCRHDYEANKVWAQFGFTAVEESRGRGKEPTVLVRWWYDHRHPTLFEIVNQCDPERVVVVADANVFYDFYDADRDGHAESSSLRADWLSDLIEIRLNNEIYNEINQSPDAVTRKLARDRASEFEIVNPEISRIDDIVAILKTCHPKRLSTFTDRDRSDLRQVASAIAGDLSYFTTRDEKLLKQEFLDAIHERFGLLILRPSDLIRRMDEIRSETSYRPASLSGTSIRGASIKGGQERELTERFSQTEAHSSFRTRLRNCLADISHYKCLEVNDGVGQRLALLAYSGGKNDRLKVTLLRVTPGKLAATLARNLLLQLVNVGVERGCSAVEIIDPYIAPNTLTAIHEAGFIENGNSFVAFQLPLLTDRAEAITALTRIKTMTAPEAERIKVAQRLLNLPLHEIPVTSFSEIESSFFPLKILDAPVPTFMVPIRPQWAKELFDSDLAAQGLFAAPEHLALRKEQAYYRSTRNSAGISAPARILWYVSKGSGKFANVGAIRACSRLIEVVVDTPKQLFSRYRRLGIYQWEDVLNVVNGDLQEKVMGLLFCETELFKEPVSLEDLKILSGHYHFGLQLQSVSRIPSSAFAEIYRKGLQRQ